MQLTILGCYAPYAPALGACSGYLVQNDGLNIMLDCGHGTFAQLQSYVDFRKLHALFISHFHPDHYVDVYAIRHAFSGALRDGTRMDPLIVYAPSEPQSIFDEISNWRDVFITIPLEDAMLRENRLGNVDLSFFRTTHPMPCFGVKISSEGKKFTYTSDTAWTNSLVSQCLDTNIILAESSLMEKDIDHTNKGHMTAKQSGLLAQKALTEKLILTHFWPEYNLNQLKREAETSFDGLVELAQMGKVFKIGVE